MTPEMINNEYVDTNEALEIVAELGIVSVSLPTLINWIQAYKIGKKVGGRWWVNRQQLIDMLEKGNPNGTA